MDYLAYFERRFTKYRLQNAIRFILVPTAPTYSILRGFNYNIIIYHLHTRALYVLISIQSNHDI